MARGDVEVVTKALKSEARMWEKQSNTLGEVHHKVEGLRITHLQAGIFQVVFDAYSRAINHMSQRTLEGRDRTDEIADALHGNARAYDDREESVNQTVKGAY